MKTIKFLAIFGIVFTFFTNNANAQKVSGTEISYWELTPKPGPFQIYCLTEVVSGTVVEIQSYTNKTYHAMSRGVLYGKKSNEEYEITYEYNQFVGTIQQGNSFHIVMPIELKHDGKLVAVIHIDGTGYITDNGTIVRETHDYDVLCK
jgi:hypothetical protein